MEVTSFTDMVVHLEPSSFVIDTVYKIYNVVRGGLPHTSSLPTLTIQISKIKICTVVGTNILYNQRYLIFMGLYYGLLVGLLVLRIRLTILVCYFQTVSQ